MKRSNNGGAVFTTVQIVYMALFTALNIALTRVSNLYIIPNLLRFNLGFIAVVMLARIVNPWVGGLCAAAADLIGYFMLPSGGAFFPGFTLNAIVVGLIYGLFRYKRRAGVVNAVMSNTAVVIIVDLVLTSCWLAVTSGTPFLTLVYLRLIKLVLIPVQAAVVITLDKALSPLIDKTLSNFGRRTKQGEDTKCS